jgi:ABC-type Mn2+/Zn2+ transport system permease subunit
MIFYITGLCLFGIFDFFELLGNYSKTHEKILFGVVFSCALALGIYYFKAVA